jgi:hypothetical protein
MALDSSKDGGHIMDQLMHDPWRLDCCSCLPFLASQTEQCNYLDGVAFRVLPYANAASTIFLIDFLDFLRRARWKVYHSTRRRCDVGRYLDVLWFCVSVSDSGLPWNGFCRLLTPPPLIDIHRNWTLVPRSRVFPSLSCNQPFLKK